jgi:Ulp1 protease family, C-terminal catalytic domain
MRKCFEHNEEGNRDSRRGRPTHNPQPISFQRGVLGITSPHFQTEQTSSARTISKPPKLVNQLQSAASISNSFGADSRLPTVITGRDRASQSSTRTEQISTRFAEDRTSGQAQASNTGRLRSSPSRLSATRSSLRAGMSTNESEEEPPKKKYSEVYGLGEPWKAPLIYPKTGKRRMAVEYEDLFRLDEDEFLNDNLIGFFLRYLEFHLEHTQPELAHRVYFYNSYFFERLMQSSKGKKGINYESVQKWTRTIDIFDRDFVIVPVNESFHWYLVIICNLSKLSTLAENMETDVGMEASPSQQLPASSRGEHEETFPGFEDEDTHDQPTEKTAESLSHLSLSDLDKQVDEVTPIIAHASLLSPQSGSNAKISRSGRRKGTRRSLPKHDVSAPAIITLDSLGIARSSTCTALRQYIVEEAKDKKGWDIDGSLIKGMTAKGIPTQPNYSDCGLYLCAYLEKFILNPVEFVGKILQREMDPDIDMPMMTSEELRSRMRGFVMELHNEQEGVQTEFPIPEIGKILLAETPIGPSPDEIDAPRTPLQDDSEDELQRDQPKSRMINATKLRPIDSTTSTRGLSKNSLLPMEPLVEPSREPLTEKRSPSKTSVLLREALATGNKGMSTKLSPTSGAKEAAITIDDDDDDVQPTSASSSTKKIPAHKDDFFDHPSELKSRIATSTTSTPQQKAKKTSKDTPPQRHRSQSVASAGTVNTDFLTGGGNQSYQHDDQDAEYPISTQPEPPPPHRPEVVVLIPDSQESMEVIDEKRDVVERKGGGQAADNEPQEILDGIE